MIELFANSEDPDQTPISVPSDLGLHSLPVTCLGVSSLQWVNTDVTYKARLPRACESVSVERPKVFTVL